jgi:enamine deaminase RidA (YjgF/YER057c/UK114 family)
MGREPNAPSFHCSITPICINPQEATMARKTIQPKTLNDPRPRYSQGILNQGGKLLFIAGQTASDKDGNVVGKGDIKAQTAQVFANLKAVLKAAGGTLDNLVMSTTYIVDREYREGYNEVRSQQYKKTPPTSTLVIVKGLAHPDYLIEIAGIAVI